MAEQLAPQAGEADPRLNAQHIAYETDGGIAARAAIGMIVLASDQTIEHESRRLLDIDGVGLYETRIHNAPAINPETLSEMEKDIAACTRLILPGLPLDVVAFGCTSGAMVIGEERVFERIREVRPGIACTTPITAAVAACHALGAARIALLTPYVDAINQQMRAFFEARGVGVPVMGSFNEENDHVVARITAETVRRTATELGAHGDIDAVFISCSSLRLLDVIGELEAALGKPVSSSNHAMAWHALRLAGVDDALPRHGALYAKGLA